MQVPGRRNGFGGLKLMKLLKLRIQGFNLAEEEGREHGCYCCTKPARPHECRRSHGGDGDTEGAAVSDGVQSPAVLEPRG